MADQPSMQISIPEDLAPGVYADFVSVWHTADVFTLDYVSWVEPPSSDSEDEEHAARRAQVVSRVRIPPSQVFEIMKALERQLSAWEQETGRSASMGE